MLISLTDDDLKGRKRCVAKPEWVEKYYKKYGYARFTNESFNEFDYDLLGRTKHEGKRVLIWNRADFYTKPGGELRRAFLNNEIWIAPHIPHIPRSLKNT